MYKYADVNRQTNTGHSYETVHERGGTYAGTPQTLPLAFVRADLVVRCARRGDVDFFGGAQRDRFRIH